MLGRKAFGGFCLIAQRREVMDERLREILLGDTDALHRAQAAEALARLGAGAQPAAVALVRAAGDPNEGVRDWAVAALEELGPPMVEDLDSLASLTDHFDLNIAYWACTLLGRLKANAAAAAPALARCLTQHANLQVRQRAAWALGQVGSAARAALPALEQAAQSPDPRLSRLARQSIELIAG
jgi:HEAT repeat protein